MADLFLYFTDCTDEKITLSYDLTSHFDFNCNNGLLNQIPKQKTSICYILVLNELSCYKTIITWCLLTIVFKK